MTTLQRVVHGYEQGVLSIDHLVCFLIGAVSHGAVAEVMASFPSPVAAAVRSHLDTFPTTEKGWAGWSRPPLFVVCWDDTGPKGRRPEEVRAAECRAWQRGVETLRTYFASAKEGSAT
jgi:hypothetical protein